MRYVIAETGPEPVQPGGAIPGALNRSHYLEKVLRPVADAILVFVGREFDEALDRPRQMSLL